MLDLPNDRAPLSTAEICGAMEALAFAAKEPIKKAALRASVRRWLAELEGDGEPADEAAAPVTADAQPAAEAAGEAPADEDSADEDSADEDSADEISAPEKEPFALRAPPPPAFGHRFEAAFALLQERWAGHEERGVRLVAVADGWAFRTHPRFGPLLRREREGRPSRLSKPALEALAIVAYRQPVTKPEIDHLRGVDCGAGLRVLLERGLIEVTGKREEPGRPLIYGTTGQFLDFFALAKLSDLPSLRQYQELHDEHLAQTRAAGLADLSALSHDAPRLTPSDGAAAEALVQAMDGLAVARAQARSAFGEHGIGMDAGDEDGPEPSLH